MDMVMVWLLFSIVSGIIGLIFVFLLRKWILAVPIEVEKSAQVAQWIKTGARAFLKREYITISYFIVAIAAIMSIAAYYNIMNYYVVL